MAWNLSSVLARLPLRRLVGWRLLCSDPRMQCSRLRKWRPSWQRRRGSATTPWWLCGRSVSRVWRTHALNITPKPAAAAPGWWGTRSEARAADAHAETPFLRRRCWHFLLQLEDVLNHTHPFSIWINGEKIDTLERAGQRQKEEFSQLEEKYAEMADGVDNIFSDSMKV